MNSASLPQLDRRASKFGAFVFAIAFTLVARPLNWILLTLGRRPLLAALMTGPRTRKRFAQVFADYVPTAHDVFVATFAKSGTNWMMQIAHQVAFRGDGEYAHIHDVICWPDLGSRQSRRIAIPLQDTRVRTASPTGLRVIKTHLSAVNVPFNHDARYLVVIRDPKEVLVSSYFFVAGVAGPLMPSPEVWLDLFLSDRFPLGFGHSWTEHTAGYWALRNQPNVLVLLFKDMKQNLPRAVQQVADVLGVPLKESEMEAVLEKSSFAFMRANEHKFTPMPKDSLRAGHGLTMMRQGQSGNSNELLTGEQQRRIDEHFEAELRRLGCDFPYRQLFALPAPAFGHGTSSGTSERSDDHSSSSRITRTGALP